MIFLRMLALVASGLVFILPPIVVADGSSHADLPGWVAVGGLAGLTLISFSFLYIGALGDRMRRSGHTRTLGGLLLTIPAAAGLTTLATRTDESVLWASGALVSFTVLLFISFVYPAAGDRRQRPMRRRERSEPALVLVQRHPSAERRGRF